MRCIGRTKQFKRCKNSASILLCKQHRFQWLIIITLTGFIGGYIQDVVIPLKSIIHSRPLYIMNNDYSEEKNDSINANTNNYFDNIAKILLLINKANYKDAQNSIELFMKDCSKYDEESMNAFKLITYYGTEDKDKINAFYEQKSRNEKFNKKDLATLAYLSFATIYFGENKDISNKCEFVKELEEINLDYFPKELYILSNLECNDKRMAIKMLLSQDYTMFNDTFFRLEQYFIWMRIANLFNDDSFYRNYALSKAWYAHPQKFAEDKFISQLGFGSILHYKKKRENLKSDFDRIDFNNESRKVLLSKKNYSTLLNYGMSLGSKSALFEFLKVHNCGNTCRDLNNILKKYDKKENTLSFSVKFKGDNIFVLWRTARDIFTLEGEDDSDKTDLIEDYSLKLLSCSKFISRSKITDITDKFSTTRADWFFDEAGKENDDYDFFIITTDGSYRLKTFNKYNITGAVKSIDFQFNDKDSIYGEDFFSTYKAKNIYFKRDKDERITDINYEFEIINGLEPNMQRKYSANACANLETHKINCKFINSAYEAFFHYDKQALQLTRLLNKEFRVGFLTYKNSILFKSLTDTIGVNLGISNYDDWLATIPENLQPQYSFFLIPLDSNYINNNVDSLVVHKQLFFLTKKYKDNFKIIKVYLLNNGEIENL